ncbi:MAG: hypothetical protein Q8L54_10565 [Devosia sp.]|nr:hypothetical protein [Devosia sp.]
MDKQKTGIDKPPRHSIKDATGKATDNPKLPKQADGAGSQPSATGKSKPHEGIKRGG